MRRGDVWLVTLYPTVGSDIQKTRPCLIVSPDDLNARLNTVIIVPLTSGSRAARFRVSTTFRGKAGLLLPDQVRTIDRMRLVKRLGSLEEAPVNAVLSILRDMFR